MKKFGVEGLFVNDFWHQIVFSLNGTWFQLSFVFFLGEGEDSERFPTIKKCATAEDDSHLVVWVS